MFFILFVFLVCGANYRCGSIQLNEQVRYSFDDDPKLEENVRNFPEFEKVSEFLQPLIEHVENRKCKRQLEALVKSLQNSSLWAVQMFDASSKIPNGLLTSDAYELGNYDACVDINLQRKDNIHGKYCLIDLSMKNGLYSQDEDVSEMELWEKLMVPIFKYGFINNLYRTAVCVPNECLSQDIESIFRFLFNNTSRKLGKEIQISASEDACSTGKVDDISGVAYVKKITSLIFLWVAIITIFELLGWFTKSKRTWINIVMNFSAYKNYKVLTSTNCQEPVVVVNSLKVFTVIIAVIIRRVSLFLEGPIMNRKDIDQIFDESFKETFFATSYNIIADTFLLLDGFIHFHRVFSYYRKNVKLNIWRVYVFQFLNMCPLYVTAILFYGYVFETFGTGPLWKERTGKLVKNCRENWMINLLNLSNFLKVNDMCIFESWYFAVVAQCFVIVPILAKITQTTSTPGNAALKLLIMTTFALPIVRFYYSLKSMNGFQNSFRNVYWHQKFTTNTLHRAFAYFIGILTSLMYLRTKKSKLKLYKIWEKTPLKVSFFLLLFAQINFKKLSPVQKACVFSFQQIFWCLFVSYIILGVSTKKLTGIAPLLTGKQLVPLGRLSFSYLLVLDLIQIYSIGIMRTLDYFSLSRMIWLSSADLLTTYVIALVFYMIVHRPISNILHETFIGKRFYTRI